MTDIHTEIREWDEERNGPMTEASIRQLFVPQGKYRVSVTRYPPASEVRGAMRAGTCYVLKGACRYTFANTIELHAGQFAELPEGSYSLEVGEELELVEVVVWALPDGFAK